MTSHTDRNGNPLPSGIRARYRPEDGEGSDALRAGAIVIVVDHKELEAVFDGTFPATDNYVQMKTPASENESGKWVKDGWRYWNCGPHFVERIPTIECPECGGPFDLGTDYICDSCRRMI